MRSSRISFAVACLALCVLATSANAATILVFGQTNPSDVVTASTSGGTTTLSSSSPLFPTSIPINITQIGGQPQPLGIAAFETLHVTSTAAPGASQDSFSGTITISTGPAGAPPIFLTGQITNGTLTVNGNGGGFVSNDTVFSNLDPRIVTQIGSSSFVGTTSLSFANLVGGPGAFTAQNSGLFSAVVPEPASLVSGSLAALAGLGCFGWRRFKASRA